MSLSVLLIGLAVTITPAYATVTIDIHVCSLQQNNIEPLAIW